MKKRVISAIVMILVVLPFLFFGKPLFSFGCAILSVLALEEFLHLPKHHQSIPMVMQIISSILLIVLIFVDCLPFSFFSGMPYSILTLVLFCLSLPSLCYTKEKYQMHDAFYMMGCLLLLGCFFHNLIFLYEKNIFYIFYFACIAITTDSFAYIVGKLFGKHKCCPTISPNKTWEGCIGGCVFGVLLSTFFYLYFVNRNIFLPKVIGITLLLSILGQFGDFVFSKIKRENDIKDFSKLIPGHGGLLDRIDSLIFIVLAYTLMFGTI